VDEAQGMKEVLNEFRLKFTMDVERARLSPPCFGVFGDPEQAVYSFSGSHVAYLTHADKLLAPPGVTWRRLTLSCTNRLTGHMVAFTNALRHREGYQALRTSNSRGEPVYVWQGWHVKAAKTLAGNLLERRPKVKASDIMIIVPSVAHVSKALNALLGKLYTGGMLMSYRQADRVKLDDSNQVVVTTRHSAKGLERPICIVLGLSSWTAAGFNQDKVQSDRGWVDDSVCSEPWHVALTRAQQELHIIAHSHFVNYATGAIDERIAFLREETLQRLSEQYVVRLKGSPIALPKERALPKPQAHRHIYTHQLLAHVSALILSDTLALLGDEAWVQQQPPSRRILVPDAITRYRRGDSFFQSVAHLTAIAIPAMLNVCGGIPGALLYSELSAAFCELEDEALTKHDLLGAFAHLPNPSADAPPSWFLKCAALWYACASPAKGNHVEFLQLEGTAPPESCWEWLSLDNAREATACLQALIEDHVDPQTVAKETLSCSVVSTSNTGRKTCTLQGQLQLRTPTAVWCIKCTQESLKDADKLELALQAYLWLHKTEETGGAGAPPTLFKLVNALRGEVWELVLTREGEGGELEWVPERCEGLRGCA
jgi:hypothetical protein